MIRTPLNFEDIGDTTSPTLNFGILLVVVSGAELVHPAKKITIRATATRSNGYFVIDVGNTYHIDRDSDLKSNS